MGQKIASLEIELAMATGGAVADLARFGGAVDKVSAQAIRDLDRIDAATKNVGDMSEATQKMVRFANETAKSAISAARELNRVEQAGERMVAQLDRQLSVFGKTTAEIRAMKAETAALAAEQAGATELAGRIRAKEQALYDAQFAAMRREAQAAESAAEDRAAAAAKSAQAAEREAVVIREAAQAHDLFNARVREGVAAMKEAEAAQLAATRAADAIAVRDAAIAYQMFEARVRAGTLALREQEAAARSAGHEAAARQIRLEAEAHDRLAAAVRASHDAQMADASAAERLRASTDPLYAATKRLNAEIEESTRLYHSGATAPLEYGRQQKVLADRLDDVRKAHGAHTDAMVKSGKGATLARHDLLNLSAQIQDIFVSLQGGQKPMTVFLQQGSQIGQIAATSGVGLRGMARSIGLLMAPMLPYAAALSVVGVGLYRWNEQLNDDAGLKKYAAGLGLTHKEMKKLGDVSVTTGDVMRGLWKTIADGFDTDVSGKKILDYFYSPDDLQQLQTFFAQIYGMFYGAYAVVVDLWGQIAPVVSGYVKGAAAAVGEYFKPVVAAAEWAADGVANVFRAVYDWAASWLASIGGALSPVLKAMGFDDASAAIGGAGSKLGATFGAAYEKGVKSFVGSTSAFVDTVGDNAVIKAQERLTKKANELKADRTPDKPKVDRHAEQLAREAEAIAAQIRNLYLLADAYGVSGAAALIAEARVKAESQAIKQRGDVEAYVDRQVRLAIAQRVSDAAKSTAAMREQATAQEGITAQVAAGLVPAERAADLVRDQLADLPLLAAIQAAQQRGLADEAARATKALDEQRAARARLTAAEIAREYEGDMAAGADQLATLREELRLVGATDKAREHALATLKATQEATAKGYDPVQAAEYVRRQVAIADAQTAVGTAQDDFNAALTITADLFDALDSSAQRAATGMSEAFGAVGETVAGALTAVTGYYAEQARMQQEHDAAIRAAGDNQQAIAREAALYALRSSGAQVDMYATMAASAKGFFKAHSTGYKAMEGAEKVFRGIQMALAIESAAREIGLIGVRVAAKVGGDAAMAVSDTARSGVEKANSLSTTAVKAVEAVVNAIRSLPFPANLAAGAATVAALGALGVAVGGGFGGGKNDLPKSNAGTGTVLGDSDAKSESLLRSIDMLADIDDATLGVSRNMLSSLRSIESSLGGLSSLLIRTGGINASGGVAEGFKTDAVGSLLGKIPVIGGLLGGLFGTKTKVVGSGLYGDSQSVGDILGGGFDASYYSDVEKKKKLFGLTTSTKYSTQLTGADGAIEGQFTLLLRGFYDTIGAAAGPLGESLDAVQQRLLGFTVDIGKIDLQGLSGTEIQEKLEAVFGAAADGMAEAALPGLSRFQKVGEGAFETLVRVASTVEQVDAAFQRLGATSGTMGVDIAMGIAGMFDSVSDFTGATDAYFEAFYSDAEQAAARTAQMGRAFAGLGVAMPATIAGYRALVDAQDLTTTAGQQMYATLLQLAPAFADLKGSMDGAASAAAIVRQRQDLEQQILELSGDTAAIRAAELAKLDPSNRALQEQIWAIEAAQDAAKAAEQLRDAWGSVGDSIMDEVKRIRGLSDAGGGGTFASIMRQFNAANAAAQGGDMDAAKSLPQLSKSLLDAAALAATSRQELDRVQAETAAILEATYAAIDGRRDDDTAATGSTSAMLAGLSAAQAATGTASTNETLVAEIKALREEVTALRNENNSGHAATARNTASVDRRLEAVTAAAGGDAIVVASAA